MSHVSKPEQSADAVNIMHAPRIKKTAKASGEEARVSFSPKVKAAFADLEAAVHFSEHFDSDIRSVLRDWAGERTVNVQDVILAFPAIAEEAFGHIQATGDKQAAEAWSEIRNQIGERGFTFSTTRGRQR